MANTIQIKRSAASTAPASLAKGELAWVDHGTGGADGVLYIGDMTAGGAAVRTIGGTGSSSFVTDILNNSALTGVPTAAKAATGTDTTQLATTSFVQQEMVANQNPISQAGDTNISAPSSAQILVYDGTDSWDNKSLSGDVTISADGVATVNGVAANSIALGTDTTGNYISTITGTANEVEVSVNGVESAAVTIGLPNDVTITGDLTVNGTTTTVDSTVVTVADPIFTLGANLADSKDRGIAMKYGAAAKFSWRGMDDTDKKFKYISDASNAGEVISGAALGNAAFGEIDGTLMTASQPNITGVGTISAGTWEGDIVDQARGGLGVSSAGWTGVATVNGGNWTNQSELAVALGGTGHQSVTQHAILVGNGTNDMTVLTAGSAGQKLAISGAGVPEWSDAVDGGTF